MGQCSVKKVWIYAAGLYQNMTLQQCRIIFWYNAAAYYKKLDNIQIDFIVHIEIGSCSMSVHMNLKNIRCNRDKEYSVSLVP